MTPSFNWDAATIQSQCKCSRFILFSIGGLLSEVTLGRRHYCNHSYLYEMSFISTKQTHLSDNNKTQQNNFLSMKNSTGYICHTDLPSSNIPDQTGSPAPCPHHFYCPVNQSVAEYLHCGTFPHMFHLRNEWTRLISFSNMASWPCGSGFGLLVPM